MLALGKFDALHRGHRALALAAGAASSSPYLLSFSGMASVLGWEPRLPVAAECDRPRILRGWSEDAAAAAQARGEKQPPEPLRERRFPFASIRHLSPEAFVVLLAKLGVAGVVCGENYRFGFRAAGDAEQLRALSAAHGLRCVVLRMVEEENSPRPLPSHAQVSSTAVRAALREGDLDRVAGLLGRRHRLVLEHAEAEGADGVPPQTPLNQPPRAGLYWGKAWVGTLGEDGEVKDGLVARQAAGVEVLADGKVRVALLRPEDALAAALARRAGSRLRVQVEL